MILVVVLNGTPICNHGQLFSVNEPECHAKSVSKNSSTHPRNGKFQNICKFESYQSKYISHLHSMIFHLPFLEKSYPYNPQRPAFKTKPSGIISVTTVRIVMKLRSHNLGMLPDGIQEGALGSGACKILNTVDGRNPAPVDR